MKKIFIVLSIVIPVVVALLLSLDRFISPENLATLRSFDSSFLPPTYAFINALTAIVLVTAVVFVKKGKIETHKNLIKTAMGLSILFLVGYVIYHATADAVIYGDLDHNDILDEQEALLVSSSRLWYLLLLISHIILSLGVIPMVLFSYYYGISNQVEKHKKLVKYSFPLWLYIAVSGVVVYLMISPYYI
jgi:putative membrane protein